MTADRTRCGNCGFIVVTGPECPLCETDLESGDFPSDVLWSLFGG